MTKVAGRTAFITGAANGIGLGIARAFAVAGAKLGLVDIDAAALATAEAELSRITEVRTVVLDMRDRAGFAAAADEIETELGPVSLVVNNAGVAGGAPAPALTYELWDWVLGVNLDGVVNGVQTFLPRMIARGGGGHIVNTASTAGLVAADGGVLYHTAKFAVVGMTEALSVELRPLGVGVTLLCPGPVATDIIARTRRLQPSVPRVLTQARMDQARAESRKKSHWLENGAQPDAVGRMVLQAVQDDRLYVLTDRHVADLVTRRSGALLAALPAT